MESMCYGITAFVTVANASIFIIQRKNLANYALNIEWDIDLEEFVVKMPSSTFGGVKELRITKENF